jgi:DUF4097 and DUF4098 domain-containing protein YvlB
MNTHHFYRTVPLLAAGFLACAGLVRAEEVIKTYTVSGHARVHIQTDDGDVRVSTGDIKQVEIRINYDGYKLDRDLHIASSQNGDSVDLSAKTSGSWGFHWGGHQKLRVEVHMPKDADLQIQTSDGSVQAESINGNLDIQTSDGSISVQGAKGQIRLRTSDGSIEGRDLDGSADMHTSDGHVNVDGRFDSLNVKTGDGSVNIRAKAGSRVNNAWSISTSDGSVDLVLPADIHADVTASTQDGHISMGMPLTVEGNFSSSQIHGKMNGGGPSITIHTGDGSIHLSKS